LFFILKAIVLKKSKFKINAFILSKYLFIFKRIAFMDNLVEILELIREKRKEKGITQADMAGKLGISQSAYKDIELGKTDLKVRTLQQIADVLGINLFSERGGKQEQSLVAVNPQNIYSDLNQLKKNQEEMNEKLNEILSLFGKKKK